MAHKLTEFEINQIIIEEAKALVEQEQLNEIFPFAAAAAVGLGTLFVGAATKATATVLGAAALGAAGGLLANTMKNHTDYFMSDPDVQLILRQSVGQDDKEEVKKATREYFDAYARLMSGAVKLSFLPTSITQKAVGTARGLASYTGLVSDFSPKTPSMDAVARQRDLLKKANAILERTPALQLNKLESGMIEVPMKSLINSFVTKEYKIAQDAGSLDEMPMKIETRARQELDKRVEALVAAAVKLNDVGRGVVQSAAPEEEPKGQAAAKAKGDSTDKSTTAQTTTRQGTTAQPSTRPRYTFNDSTPEEVRGGKEVIKPFDKSSRSGIVGYIQSLLQRAGFNIAVDGFFGNKTKQAVLDFKQRSGMLQEQTDEAVVDSKLLQKLETFADDKEIENIAKGEILPSDIKAAPGKVSEEDADDLPASVLSNKIKKLEARIEAGVKNEEKAEARLERMKARLARKTSRRIKRMKNKQLENIIREELMAILSESTDQLMTKYGRAYDSFARQRRAWFNTYIEQTIRNKSYRKADERVATYKSLYHDPFDGLERDSKAFSGNQAQFQDWFEEESKYQLKKFKESALALIRKLGEENYYSVGEAAETQEARKKLLLEVIPLADPAFTALRNVYVVQKDPEITTVDLGDDGVFTPTTTVDLGDDGVFTPTTTTAAPKQTAASKPTANVSGIPADWRTFASKGAKHAEMAKAWLAATAGGRLTEAAIPRDSSYKAFQDWYTATAAELGREFGPTEAIKLIKASPKTASPEQIQKIRKTMAAAPTTTVDKIGGERFNLQAELSQLQAELSQLKGKLAALMKRKPTVANTFKAGETPKVQLPADKLAFGEMKDLNSQIIAKQGEIATLQGKIAKLQESTINESTYNRWQKLIKG